MNRLHIQALTLFGVSLLASLVFCWVIFPLLGETTSGMDPDGYGAAGQNWFVSGRFQAIDKAPLYPAFIALIAWITGGHRVWNVQVAQCILWALTVVVIFAVYHRTLSEDEPLPFVAGLVCAVYPIGLWYTPRLWTETFLTFGVALYTLALVTLLQQPGARQAILCGFAAGFVALSKGIALVFFPLTILALVVVFRRAAWRWAALFSLAALVWLAPWSWRNWQATGGFIPVHIDGGYNFYLGNGFARHWHEAPFSYVELKKMTLQDLDQLHPGLMASTSEPVQRDRQLLQIALSEWADRPIVLVRKLCIQSLTFWYLAGDFHKSALTGILQAPVVLLTLVGVVRGWRARSWALSLAIPVIGMMGVSVVVFAFARLSATVMPYCLGLAIYGIWSWAGKRLTRLTPE